MDYDIILYQNGDEDKLSITEWDAMTKDSKKEYKLYHEPVNMYGQTLHLLYDTDAVERTDMEIDKIIKIISFNLSQLKADGQLIMIIAGLSETSFLKIRYCEKTKIMREETEKERKNDRYEAIVMAIAKRINEDVNHKIEQTLSRTVYDGKTEPFGKNDAEYEDARQIADMIAKYGFKPEFRNPKTKYDCSGDIDLDMITNYYEDRDPKHGFVAKQTVYHLQKENTKKEIERNIRLQATIARLMEERKGTP